MSDAYTELADRYDRWFEKHPQLFRSEAEAVRQFLPPKGRFLEIGAGTGVFSEKLGITEGVEPSEAMAAYAVRRGIRIYPGCAQALPLPAQQYDAAVMITVDCFLDDVTQSFREAHRVLQPQGSLIVAFLNRESPLGQVYERKKADNVFYRGAHFHSSAEMHRFLEEAGFAVQEEIQTVTTLEDRFQPFAPGAGEGVFTVIRARKKGQND